MKRFSLLFVLFIMPSLQAMELQRVILSSDDNPKYLDFWPLAAHAWEKVVGIKPTLALIAPPEVEIDETLGDVIRFDPIPGIPTSLQAQVIRLLLPSYFPDEVCLVSDLDMLPLQKEYFVQSITGCDEESFVVFRDGAYAGIDMSQYPMCYLAAKGKTFQNLFGLPNVQSIPEMIQKWNGFGFGWNTDEKVLYQTVQEKKDQIPIHLLGQRVSRRIDRVNWHYDQKLLKVGYYIDSHLLRPYKENRKEIDLLAKAIGINPLTKDLEIALQPTHSTQDATRPQIVASQSNKWRFLDKDGMMLPWFTEPFLGVLSTWDINNWEILELGSGHSTIWLAKHCKRLVSIENNPHWAAEVKKQLQQEAVSNVTLKIANLESNEQASAARFMDAIGSEQQKFDCIIIDNEPVEIRNLCCQESLKYIKPGGVIILENANQLTCGIDSSPSLIFLSPFEHHTFQQPGHPDWRTDYWVIPESKISTNKMTPKQKNRQMPGDPEYGTHVTPLITAVENTTGPVMEMGCGDFSTPLLHTLCSKRKRFLLSTEANKDWMNLFTDLERSWHHFQNVPVDEWTYEQLGHPPDKLWDHVGKETHWGVVFVDHSPGERRVQDIERLRNQADIIVVHDTQQHTYNYEPTISSFKYRYDYERYFTRTTLLSETIDVAKLFECD